MCSVELNKVSNIDSVVDKAKRAASKLWLLLHAQDCRIGSGGRCPHAGCSQAKMLNLHLKSCPAKGSNSPCPAGHQGCDQARKLLAHFKQCRNTRKFQQAFKHHSQRELKQTKQHSCLICSMVARKAKSILYASSTSGGSVVATTCKTVTKLRPIMEPVKPQRPPSATVTSLQQLRLATVTPPPVQAIITPPPSPPLSPSPSPLASPPSSSLGSEQHHANEVMKAMIKASQTKICEQAMMPPPPPRPVPNKHRTVSPATAA